MTVEFFIYFQFLLCFITGVVDGVRVTVKNFLSRMVVVVVRRGKEEIIQNNLTLPLPSLLVPTPFTKGVCQTPLTISKTIALMNLKFCRVLETSFKVSEMLKLFT